MIGFSAHMAVPRMLTKWDISYGGNLAFTGMITHRCLFQAIFIHVLRGRAHAGEPVHTYVCIYVQIG